jgi:hypothetical protein
MIGRLQSNKASRLLLLKYLAMEDAESQLRIKAAPDGRSFGEGVWCSAGCGCQLRSALRQDLFTIASSFSEGGCTRSKNGADLRAKRLEFRQ